MKTKEQIDNKIIDLRIKLDDALENPDSNYDANDLQVAIDELGWVLI